MTRRAIFVGILSALVAMIAWVASAAPRVCSHCGYESPDEVMRCTHCDALLPAIPSPKPIGVPSEQKPGEQFVEFSRVREEVILARKYFSEGNFELARLFAQNAMALDLLSDRADRPEGSALIAELLEASRKRSRVLTRPCEECGGSGTSSIQVQGLDGTVMERQVRGRTCTSCGGEGYVVVNATVSESKQAKGQALRSYTTLQLGRQYESRGNAWVPPEIADSLSVKQVATILAVTASPCSDCMGTGREDCGDCRGTGRQKCPVKNCSGGRVPVKRRGTLIKDTSTILVKCRVCNGMSFITCEDCLGKGYVLCEDCQGKGERDLCRKCSGLGYADCRKCGGTGKDKGVECEECSGGRYVLCRSCMGDGRAK